VRTLIRLIPLGLFRTVLITLILSTLLHLPAPKLYCLSTDISPQQLILHLVLLPFPFNNIKVMRKAGDSSRLMADVSSLFFPLSKFTLLPSSPPPFSSARVVMETCVGIVSPLSSNRPPPYSFFLLDLSLFPRECLHSKLNVTNHRLPPFESQKKVACSVYSPCRTRTYVFPLHPLCLPPSYE